MLQSFRRSLPPYYIDSGWLHSKYSDPMWPVATGSWQILARMELPSILVIPELGYAELKFKINSNKIRSRVGWSVIGSFKFYTFNTAGYGWLILHGSIAEEVQSRTKDWLFPSWCCDILKVLFPFKLKSTRVLHVPVITTVGRMDQKVIKPLNFTTS